MLQKIFMLAVLYYVCPAHLRHHPELEASRTLWRSNMKISEYFMVTWMFKQYFGYSLSAGHFSFHILEIKILLFIRLF